MGLLKRTELLYRHERNIFILSKYGLPGTLLNIIRHSVIIKKIQEPVGMWVKMGPQYLTIQKKREKRVSSVLWTRPQKPSSRMTYSWSKVLYKSLHTYVYLMSLYWHCAKRSYLEWQSSAQSANYKPLIKPRYTQMSLFSLSNCKNDNPVLFNYFTYVLCTL